MRLRDKCPFAFDVLYCAEVVRLLKKDSPHHASWVRALLFAASCVVAAYLARLPLDMLIPGQVPFVTFYPAVMAAALIAGFRAGLIAVILPTPRAMFAVNFQYPYATTIVWLVLGCITAAGCGLARELRANMQEERDELARTKQKLELVIQK